MRMGTGPCLRRIPDFTLSDFMSSKSPASKPSRQATFAHVSQQAMSLLRSLPRNSSSPQLPAILLTGGLRTPRLLQTALASHHAELLGIGRGSILCPNLPDLLKERPDLDADEPFRLEPDLSLSSSILGLWPLCMVISWIPKIPLVGAGVGMAWYVVQMRELAAGHSRSRESNTDDVVVAHYGVGPGGAIARMWLWTNMRRPNLDFASSFFVYGTALVLLSSTMYLTIQAEGF